MNFEHIAADGYPFRFGLATENALAKANDINAEMLLANPNRNTPENLYHHSKDLVAAAHEHLTEWERKNGVNPYLMSCCPANILDLEHHGLDRLSVYQRAQNTLPRRLEDRIFKRRAEQRVEAWRQTAAMELVIRYLAIDRRMFATELATSVWSSAHVH